MNTIFIIFTALTASIALLGFAETSGDPALHLAEDTDDVEDDNKIVEKSNVAGSGIGYSNVNRIIPQLQAQFTSSPRPGPMFVDAVECHVCVDCPYVYENISTKLCPHTLDVTRQNRCVTYAERYKHMKRTWYIRGCASERGSCDDIRKAHAAHSDIVVLSSCYECEGDKCNSSAGFRSLSDITFSIFAVFVVPIVGKYTLS